MTEHPLSFELKSLHDPIVVNGAFAFPLCTLMDVTTFLILAIPASTSSTILFFPNITMTFLGLKVIAAVKFNSN